MIDSKGNPTVEVDLVTFDDLLYRSVVLSGASTRIYKALDLRDGDKSIYGGKGVLNAVKNINEFWGPKLVGVDDRTVYHTLKGIIKAKYGQDACNVGDEGGFSPNVRDNREGLVFLMDAIEKAGYTGKIKIVMDVAVSEFLTKDAKYELNFKNQPNDGAHVLSAQGLCELYKEFVKDFPILVGDDFLVTNPKRIAEAIQKKACNALLLKVNQTGTVTESIQVALDSKVVGWGVMISHRSGETEDNFIADLSVGLANGQIKTGAPYRSPLDACATTFLEIPSFSLEDMCLILDQLTGQGRRIGPKFFERPAEVRDPRGLTEDLIRISAGIEYVNDLIDDLDYALKTGPA
ncbi:Enolase [Capsicum baccatum]|uniref:phosphopyruvate hydratase n=1 Tax=Capsicum baccatum TaxID=33114 RepID=A0A2G2WXF1_CAPBA|nr:Enolase [Capsicum baccatum]